MKVCTRWGRAASMRRVLMAMLQHQHVGLLKTQRQGLQLCHPCRIARQLSGNTRKVLQNNVMSHVGQPGANIISCRYAAFQSFWLSTSDKIAKPSTAPHNVVCIVSWHFANSCRLD
ncbi:TPA: hypothetical protein ACH3X2_001491 [Trebouxia sp. C0005]